MSAPRSRRVSRFCWVAGLSNMLPSMAGATISGAAVARTVAVSMSSASPWTILAMTLAVAGAMMTASARLASITCSTLVSESASKRSRTTLLWVRLLKVSGVTNSMAERVMMTSTSAPAWVSLLARSAAL